MTADAHLIMAQREALCKWLTKYRWTFFVTLTFRLPLSGRTALKHGRRLLFYIGTQTEKPTWAFMATEWFKSGESVHIHGLIGVDAEPVWRPFWEWWTEHYGISWWRVYDERLGAGYYVTKYIWKEENQLGWWDFFTEKPRWTVDKGQKIFQYKNERRHG